MSAVVVPLARPATARPRTGVVASARVVVQLAPGEAWRLLRHPLFLAGFALNVVLASVVADNGPRDAFDVVSTASTFFTGVFVYFAANLTATRTRRAGGEELLAPLPAGAHERTLALCLAALAPALLTAALVLSTHVLLDVRDIYVVEPSAAHLAAGPLTVLGGALLGIMVARWAPYAGVAGVVMVAMVAFDVWTSDDPDRAPIGTYLTWATYGPDGHWYGLQPGSATWHAVYLVLLCAMAATGAVLRTAARPLVVLSVGAALTGCAVGAGAAALP